MEGKRRHVRPTRRKSEKLADGEGSSREVQINASGQEGPEGPDMSKGVSGLSRIFERVKRVLLGRELVGIDVAGNKYFR